MADNYVSLKGGGVVRQLRDPLVSYLILLCVCDDLAAGI